MKVGVANQSHDIHRPDDVIGTDLDEEEQRTVARGHKLPGHLTNELPIPQERTQNSQGLIHLL